MSTENENTNSIFGSINYREPHELNKFIDEMNIDQAIFCLVHSARHSHKLGVFSIEESEVVSKAIRVLTTPKPLPKEESGDEQE